LQFKLELINLENEESNSDSETDVKMDFSYDIALKLTVLNDTNSESVRDFLNIVECLYDNLKVEAQPILIKFILKSRIQIPLHLQQFDKI
jgi:hypothetical protein